MRAVCSQYRRLLCVRLGTLGLIASIVTGLLFVGTMVTGGLLSAGTNMPAAVLRAHQVTPFLTALSTAATLFVLLSRK